MYILETTYNKNETGKYMNKDIEIQLNNVVIPLLFCRLENAKINELYTNIYTKIEHSENNKRECTVEMRMQWTQQREDKININLDIAIRGIFSIYNVESKDFEKVMRVNCCAMLYPYLREAVSRVSSTSLYGKPYFLPSKNFVKMYNEWLNDKKHQNK